MKLVLCLMFIGLFTACGTDFSDPVVGTPGANGSNGANGQDGQDGDDGLNGTNGKSCTVKKEKEKCYLRCPDGTWGYLGEKCGS